MINIPELPKVSQDFEADVAPYVAAIEEAIAANERFIASIRDAITEVEELQAAISHLDGKVVTVTVKYVTEGQPDKIQEAVQVVTNVGTPAGGGDPFASIEEGATRLQQDLNGVREGIDAVKQDLDQFQAGANEAAAPVEKLGLDLITAGESAKVFGGGLDLLGGSTFTALARMNTLGGVIHWVIAGSAELLAVGLPAIFGAAAGAMVLYQGTVESVYPHISALYTTMEALGPMFGKTSGDILGTGHALQAAQDAANPVAYSLLGDAVLIAQAHLSTFASTGTQVATVLDNFGAKLAVDLTGPMKNQIQGLLSTAVTDLTEFGQVLGNVGHALLDFASAMPGLAEVLLKLIDGISQVILWISKLPAPLLMTIMVFEEMYRWGGLLNGVFLLIARGLGNLPGLFAAPVVIIKQFGEGLLILASSVPLFLNNIAKMTGAMQAFFASLSAGSAEEGVAGLFGKIADGASGAALSTATFIGELTPLQAGLIAVGAAGVGFLIYKLLNAKDAMQQFIAASNQAVSSASNFNIIGTVANQLVATMGKLVPMTKETATAFREVNGGSRDGGAALIQYNADTQALHQHMQSLYGDLTTYAANVSYLSATYKTGYVGALALATEANVNLTKSLAGNSAQAIQSRMQIAALVTGYEAMGQPAGAIGEDMNMIGVQSALANSKVQQLNQSMQAWLGDITGLTSGLSGLEENIQQMGNTADNTGKKFSTFTGTANQGIQQIAHSLTSFTGQSAQAWQNFDSTLSQAGNYLQALNVDAAAGAISQQQYGQATKAVVSLMVPYAQYSQAAQGEVLGLANAAGIQATSFGQVKSATMGVNQAQQVLNQITQQTTGNMGNLAQVAQNLSVTLQSAVVSALDSAKVAASGLSGEAKQLWTDMNSGKAPLSAVTSDENQMTATLQKLGLGHQQALNYVQAFTGGIGSEGNTATTASGKIQSLTATITGLGSKSSSVKGLVDSLSNSVVLTGSHSSATASLAQQLISALERVGVNAGTAKGDVDGLIAAINSLPTSKTVTIYTNYVTTGGGASMGINPGAAGLPKAATGMRIPGYGGGDIVPALLEPGEAVVPKHLVGAVAPFLKSQGVPGFASGSTNVANRAAAAAQDAAMLAKFFPTAAIPAPAPAAPAYFGSDMPSYLMGLGGTPPMPPLTVPSAASTGASHPVELTNHIKVHLDGREIWRGQQKDTLRYNLRNNGVPTGLQKPR